MENREVIQQYSLEWYKEMRKLNKDTIISLVESNGKQRDTLKEQITKLQSELKAADSVNEWINKMYSELLEKHENSTKGFASVPYQICPKCNGDINIHYCDMCKGECKIPMHVVTLPNQNK